ncbi:MAG: DUF2165 domain-containing protein [Acetobacter sp.]|jgi:predicted small integral membrane protein|nr:DUF2165 domain-containing protein [Acetobacter sp.]MCH4061652.1 DUF2165 domain-containing protein [Acetobacter sp.]MCH4089499.1 DUF2165 domain-containing protein [Acetobacter sp.]MCI1294897.1 DUF2165 domain-containing protein [Acetobacter sp.]MCI1321365.1 DUF2165 domain-containing protein [Acetobacter sp.]
MSANLHDDHVWGRIAKLVMTGSLAAFGLLVTLNNLTDYNSNFMFVRHTLSMDTTFPGNALSWRAVGIPWLWHGFYLLIIAGEALTGILFCLATRDMLVALKSDDAAFRKAKRLVPLGTATGFLIWFSGFSVVGGEWFVMWQSHLWNGQEAAFRFFMTMIGVCIYVMQPE